MPLRASAIIRVAVERQHLAAIATRRIDRALQLGEAALHEFRAIRAGRHGNLDPGSGLAAVFTMRREHDGVAQAAGSGKATGRYRGISPARRRRHRHRDTAPARLRWRVPAVPGQCGEGQRLVAVLLIDAEKPHRSCGEQPVDGDLNIRAHMTRELAARSQPADPADAGKMPGQRVAGVLELLAR